MAVRQLQACEPLDTGSMLGVQCGSPSRRHAAEAGTGFRLLGSSSSSSPSSSSAPARRYFNFGVSSESSSGGVGSGSPGPGSGRRQTPQFQLLRLQPPEQPVSEKPSHSPRRTPLLEGASPSRVLGQLERKRTRTKVWMGRATTRRVCASWA